MDSLAALGSISTTVGLVAFCAYLFYKFCKEHRSHCQAGSAVVDITPSERKDDKNTSV